ncbi:MAG: DnaJ domain-containing protein [Cyanobacteria bacterium Co-bin13]|nr:DnaJ domain-containing protein [Cyanobacteria bacterium Co-bin13]
MSEIDRCFEILELRPGASKQQIKESYRRLAKRWHPDQFSQSDPQRQQAEVKIKLINDAYQRLKESPASESARSAPAQAAKQATTDIKTRPNSPQDHCAEANELMQEGKYEEAAELLGVVIKRHPTYAEAYRYRGLIYSLLGYELRPEADLSKAKSLGLRRSRAAARSATNSPPKQPRSSNRAAQTSAAAAQNHSPSPETRPQSQPFAAEIECQLTFAESRVSLGAIALSPNLKLMAAGSDSGAVYLWNYKTRQSFHTLEGHTGAIQSLLFSQDSQFLFSSSADGTIKLWHLASGSLIRTLAGHAGGVASIAISWPHKVLVSGGDDGTVGVWDLKSNLLLRKILDQDVPVRAVALNPAGEIAVCGSADGSIKLCHVLRGGILQWSEQHRAAVSAIATSPTAKYFVSGSEDGQVALWDVAGDYLRSLQPSGQGVTALLLAHRDTVVVGGGVDGYLRIWNAETGQLLQSQSAHRGPVRGLCAVPGTEACLSLGADRAIKLWQLRHFPVAAEK